jgi:hypothetical protein
VVRQNSFSPDPGECDSLTGVGALHAGCEFSLENDNRFQLRVKSFLPALMLCLIKRVAAALPIHVRIQFSSACLGYIIFVDDNCLTEQFSPYYFLWAGPHFWVPCRHVLQW